MSLFAAISSSIRMVYGIAKDGRALWQYSAAKRVRSTPLCLPDSSTKSTTLYFGSDDHSLYAINVI